MNIPNRKRCRDCSLEKSLDDFYADKGNKDGRQGFCKDCGRIRTRRWYDKRRGGPYTRKSSPLISKNGTLLGNNKNKKYRQWIEDRCRRCGFIPEDPCQLTVDHIDQDKKNCDQKNLQTLCANCHNFKTKIERVSPEKLIILNLKPSTS